MAENLKKKAEITTEKIVSFLEGNDPQERIVNLEYTYTDPFIRVYYRDEEDNKCSRSEAFYPFLWAKKIACLKLCDGDKQAVKALLKKYNIGVKSLDCTNDQGEVVPEMKDGYAFMFYAKSAMSYSDFLDFFKEAKNPVYSDDKKKNDDEAPAKAKKDDRQYLSVTPQEQFLISTGKRFFKGYGDYDQTLRMIFDLETTGLDTKKDRIEQFGIRFNRQVKYHGKYMTFERIYNVEGQTEEEKDKSELEHIETFLKIIYTFKPDIISAHNGEAFDWNIIIGACERLGHPLEDISKKYFDGKGIRKNPKETILKLGGEIEKFNQTIVPHTIITDSLHAVRRAQATDSNFKEANLKYATAYLDLKKENRVYVPGAKISEVSNDFTERYAFNNTNGDWYILDPESNKPFVFDGKTKRDFIPKFNNLAEGYKLVSGKYIVERYLLDDLWECDKVELALNQSAFNICKNLPLPFQKCCTMGTAGQWKALMLAWSYENNLAIPYAENSGKFTGGLSRLLKVGSTGKRGLVKLDYNSLYPSIILTWGIEDKMDISGATLKFLNYFLTSREAYKKEKKAANKIIEKYEEKINEGKELTAEEEREYNKALTNFALADNLQAVRKVFCNSFFGSYGSNNGAVYPWKSVACAERTTCTGRQALRLMIGHFSNIGKENNLGPEYNYEPIVGDSFTEDTPVFIKYYDTDLIDIKPISELINERDLDIDEFGREYDLSNKNYKVLCRSGWIKPSYIYRHKTDKDIYKITTDSVEVEVTEDHSLYNKCKKKIKPSEITKDTVFEYSDKPIFGLEFSDDEEFPELAKRWGKDMANGVINRVPLMLLNSNKKMMEKFYYSFIDNYDENKEYSKTCLAGLQFIKRSIKKGNDRYI